MDPDMQMLSPIEQIKAMLLELDDSQLATLREKLGPLLSDRDETERLFRCYASEKILPSLALVVPATSASA